MTEPVRPIVEMHISNPDLHRIEAAIGQRENEVRELKAQRDALLEGLWGKGAPDPETLHVVYTEPLYASKTWMPGEPREGDERLKIVRGPHEPFVVVLPSDDRVAFMEECMRPNREPIEVDAPLMRGELGTVDGGFRIVSSGGLGERAASVVTKDGEVVSITTIPQPVKSPQLDEGWSRVMGWRTENPFHPFGQAEGEE